MLYLFLGLFVAFFIHLSYNLLKIVIKKIRKLRLSIQYIISGASLLFVYIIARICFSSVQISMDTAIVDIIGGILNLHFIVGFIMLSYGILAMILDFDKKDDTKS